jgi:hypothetical protein
MFSGYYNYSVHFATFNQLFISNFWGDGPSVWGTDDKMSFMIGYLHWIIPLIMFILSSIKYYKTKKYIYLIPLGLFMFGLGYAFMAHERSTFIWMLLSPIQKVQFPWRFLNIVIFLTSLSTTYITLFTKNKIIPAIIIFFVILLNYQYFYPIHSGPITDTQKLSGESWRLLTTASIYDYLPKTAKIAGKKAAQPYLDEITPNSTKYEISGQKKGTDWLFYNLNLKSDALITFPVLGFPNFKLFDFGKEIRYSIEPELGRITVNLSSGDHQLYLKLFNTTTRTVSNLISLLAWSFIVTYYLYSLWKKLKLKK